MKHLLITLVFGLTLAAHAQAQTQYVSDVMYVPMRSGAGNEYRIIHSRIRTGTEMTVLEAEEGSDWAKVRTPSGLEGWIRQQYLISSPTARQQLTAALEEMNKAKDRAEALTAELKALRDEHSELQKTATTASKTKASIEDELRNLKMLSADAVNLSHRYKTLLADHELLKTDFDTMRAENDRLRHDKTVSQWLFGSGLVVLGMFLMLVLPALKPKKRNTEWAN